MDTGLIKVFARLATVPRAAPGVGVVAGDAGMGDASDGEQGPGTSGGAGKYSNFAGGWRGPKKIIVSAKLGIGLGLGLGLELELKLELKLELGLGLGLMLGPIRQRREGCFVRKV